MCNSIFKYDTTLIALSYLCFLKSSRIYVEFIIIIFITLLFLKNVDWYQVNILKIQLTLFLTINLEYTFIKMFYNEQVNWLDNVKKHIKMII